MNIIYETNKPDDLFYVEIYNVDNYNFSLETMLYSFYFIGIDYEFYSTQDE